MGQGNKAVDVANLSVMVSVAQLVEPRIVIPVVAGSIPVAHPIFSPMPSAKGKSTSTAWTGPERTRANYLWLYRFLNDMGFSRRLADCPLFFERATV